MVILNGLTVAFIMKTHKYGGGHFSATARPLLLRQLLWPSARSIGCMCSLNVSCCGAAMIPFLLLRLRDAVDEPYAF